MQTGLSMFSYALDVLMKRSVIRTRGMDGRQTVHQTTPCDARNREF